MEIMAMSRSSIEFVRRWRVAVGTKTVSVDKIGFLAAYIHPQPW